jgi:hypothetical protein
LFVDDLSFEREGLAVAEERAKEGQYEYVSHFLKV